MLAFGDVYKILELTHAMSWRVTSSEKLGKERKREKIGKETKREVAKQIVNIEVNEIVE